MKFLLLGLGLGLLTLLACTTSDDKKIPIAILTPTSHPSLEQTEQGFKDYFELNHPGKYSFVTYNAHGNKALMRSEIETIAHKNYPLVLTIGTSSSSLTKEVFTKKGLTTPIVFTSVNDPMGFGIEGPHITGVQELVDFEAELEQALLLKPDIHKLLLVLNPMEPGIARDAKQVETSLKKRNITLITAEVFQTNEISAKVTPLIGQADAVLVLKDNTVVSGLDALVKLCNHHQIPLLTSDLDSPERGAAFGYGVHESAFGVEAAKKALTILEKQISPHAIPVTPVSDFTCIINSNAAALQGIELK